MKELTPELIAEAFDRLTAFEDLNFADFPSAEESTNADHTIAMNAMGAFHESVGLGNAAAITVFQQRLKAYFAKEEEDVVERVGDVAALMVLLARQLQDERSGRVDTDSIPDTAPEQDK